MRIDIESNKKIINIVLYILLFLILSIQSYLIIKSGFTTYTDKLITVEPYNLESGVDVKQELYITGDHIYGFTVQLFTYTKVNEGNLNVKFYEDDSLLKEWNLDTKYIVDGKYQKFFLDRIIKINKDKKYYIVLNDSYSGENSLAIGTFGSDLNSLNNKDFSVAYQIIESNYSYMMKCFIIVWIIIFTIFAILFFKIDFNVLKIKKLLLMLIILPTILFAIKFDLFEKINQNVVVYPMNDEKANSSVEIHPSEERTFEFEQFKDKFETLEIFSTSSDIQITLKNLTTNEIYFENTLADVRYEELVSKKAIILTASNSLIGNKYFEKGKYSVTITNLSDDGISIDIDDEKSQNIYIIAKRRTDLGVKIAIACIMICSIYILIGYILTNKNKMNIEKFYLMTVIPLSLIFFIFLQPWSVPDTGVHFLETYRYANIILGAKGEEEYYLRNDDYNYYCQYWRHANPSMKEISYTTHEISLIAKDTSMVKMPRDIKHMNYYSIFNYLPQVLGIVAGRILNLGTVPMITLARIGILIVYILGCYLAIKKTPIGKGIFAIIALLPNTLTMSSSLSYDALVIVTTLNFISSVLRLYYDNTRKNLIMSLIWIFLIGSIKGGGFLILIPLIFLIISNKKSTSKEIWKSILAILGVGILSIVIFDVIIPSGSQLFQFGTEGDGKLSVAFSYTHPIQFIKMLLETYLRQFSQLMIDMMGNTMGILESVIPILFLATLIVVTIIYSIFEKDEISFESKDQKILLFVILLALITTPIMLLSWTQIGNESIDGLQGRYFIPILPLILLLITKFRLRKGVKNQIVNDENINSTQSLIEKDDIENTLFKWMIVIFAISIYYLLRLYLIR